jgi:geranylgeranyl reductase family protein
MTYDVIVVGAGPAGSATAILLAERGWSVLLLDKASFPRPKICGELLSPESARLLDRLGALKAVDAEAQPIAGMRIVAPDGTRLEGRYPPGAPWGGYRGHGLAIPRERLDHILFERARQLPLDARERHRVTGLRMEAGAIAGVQVEAPASAAREVASRLVVAADGRASVVAHALGLLRPHRLRRMALIQHVRGLEGLGDLGEIYVDPPDYAILNPVAPGLANLGLVVPHAHARAFRGRLDIFFAARLAQLRHLAPRLGGMAPVGPLMAMGPLAYRVHEPRVGGVALVGDAAGFYDPFTGEGLYTALRSAELLAEVAHAALRAGDCSRAALVPYSRARHAAFRGKARLTRALQTVIGHRRLADGAARLLARRPALLDAVMGVLGDFIPAGALLDRSLLRAARAPD